MATATQPAQRLLDDHRTLLFVLTAAVVLVYANTLAWVASFWERPEYSHGYLIPVFACALLWMRKPESEEISPQESKIGMILAGVGVAALLLVSSVKVDSFYPGMLNNVVSPGILAFLPCLAGAVILSGKSQLADVTAAERWWGVAIIAGGLLLRLVLSWFAVVTAEMATLLPCLAGAVVIAGGWRALAWSWPAIAFLVFMFPLPDFLERGLLAPLQRFATISSTFCLQTIGLPAFREGNRINIGDLELGVVDACSGLRMLTIFFALSTAITLVTNRPLWERVVIILSAIPIALVVNVVRITVTGVLYKYDPKLAERVFHDLAGWVMMPMALGLLYCELQILSHLVQEDDGEVSMDLMESSGGHHGAHLVG